MSSSWRWGWSVLVALGLGPWLEAQAQAQAQRAPAPDACAFLRRADVEAAFSPRSFGPAKLQPVLVKVTEKNAATLAAVTDCTITSTEASAKERLTVNLKLRRAPSDTTGVTPAQARAGAVQLKAVPVDVAGLGEGAYWVNLGSSARPQVQLNLFRGKREWLIFSASGKGLDAAAALAGLTKVAQASAAAPPPPSAAPSAAPAAAQAAPPAQPTTVTIRQAPPDDYTKAVVGYPLDLPKLERYAAAVHQLRVESDRDPSLLAPMREQPPRPATLEESAARLERQPRIKAILDRHQLTGLDFVLVPSVVQATGVQLFAEQAGHPVPPDRANAGFTAIFKANREKIEALWAPVRADLQVISGR